MFDSISVNANYKGDYPDYVKGIPNQFANGKVLCTNQTTTELVSLEAYAKQNGVTQVTIAWKEPHGWSNETQAMLDPLEAKEITVSRIQGDVAKFVHESRFYDLAYAMTIAALIPFVLLGLGFGIDWAVGGFRR